MNTAAIPFEKRSATIAFRLPDGLHRWLEHWASVNGTTISTAILIICQRFQASQDLSGKPPGILRRLADQLQREIDIAVEDGMITAAERNAISKPAVALLNFIWNPQQIERRVS